jgi:hypothetical protein
LDNEKPKIEPLYSQIWEGNRKEKNHEGVMNIFPTKSQGERRKTASRKLPRKGSENHQKGKPRRTQTSHEEPRRIIYTYHEGSYRV